MLALVNRLQHWTDQWFVEFGILKKENRFDCKIKTEAYYFVLFKNKYSSFSVRKEIIGFSKRINKEQFLENKWEKQNGKVEKDLKLEKDLNAMQSGIIRTFYQRVAITLYGNSKR